MRTRSVEAQRLAWLEALLDDGYTVEEAADEMGFAASVVWGMVARRRRRPRPRQAAPVVVAPSRLAPEWGPGFAEQRAAFLEDMRSLERELSEQPGRPPLKLRLSRPALALALAEQLCRGAGREWVGLDSRSRRRYVALALRCVEALERVDEAQPKAQRGRFRELV